MPLISWNYENKDITDKWVLEGVREDMPKWNNLSTIVIATPTGTGKNTFIIDGLLPYAQSKNKKVLILSNRVALNIQQKRILWEATHSSKLSTEELKNCSCFENALVFSYQSIIHELSYPHQSYIFNNVGYIVFDEAHFFVSDSRFNSKTELILYTIINRFLLSAVKIYMTATPDQIMKTISEYEELYLRSYCRHNPNIAKDAEFPLTLYTYTAKPNYKNYAFRFFDEWSNIANQIKNSPPEEKWLIFVKDKSDFSVIKSLLHNIVNKNKIDCIDAEEKDSTAFLNIINNEKFESRVLISTSAMDNGVNFSDSQLKHIVVDSLDPVSAVQMVGRKRCAKDEKIHIYFKIPKLAEVNDYLTLCKSLLEYIENYQNNPYAFIDGMWGRMSQPLQKLFYLQHYADTYNNQYFFPILNRLAHVRLSHEKDNLSNLKELLEKDVPYGFEKKVFTWFNKNEDDFIDDMRIKIDVDAIRIELIEWLDHHDGVYITNDNIENVSNEFFEYCWLISSNSITNNKKRKQKKLIYKSTYISDIKKQLVNLDLPYEFNKLSGQKRGNEKWVFSKK